MPYAPNQSMRSIEPEDRGSEINGGQKMTRCCVSAGGTCAIWLEFAEYMLNQVSCPIKVFVIIARLFAVSFGWDDRCCSSLLEKIKNPFVSSIGLICQKSVSLKVGQKSIRPIQIARLTWRQHKAGGVSSGPGSDTAVMSWSIRFVSPASTVPAPHSTSCCTPWTFI